MIFPLTLAFFIQLWNLQIILAKHCLKPPWEKRCHSTACRHLLSRDAKDTPRLDCPSPKNSQEKPKTTDIPAFFEKSRVPPANSVPDENIDFPNFQNSSPKPTLTEEKIVSEARD